MTRAHRFTGPGSLPSKERIQKAYPWNKGGMTLSALPEVVAALEWIQQGDDAVFEDNVCMKEARHRARAALAALREESI